MRWSLRDKNGLTEEEEQQHKDRAWPVDPENNVVDLRCMRPTDLPFNKRVFIPQPIDKETEIEMQQVKANLIKETRKYIEEEKEKCMKHQGNRSNLTKEEERGLKSLKERNDIVVFQTDKSGKLSVDTKDNYRQACGPHIEKDVSVTEAEIERAEKEANAHSMFWVRILSAGQFNDGEFRIRNNMKTEDSTPPPLYALRKDHKATPDPHIGPPVRPVCGATTAYTNRLSHVLCVILNQVWKNEESVCSSTEEMLAEIDLFNTKFVKAGTTVIGSADVKALYPSLDVEFTVEKTCELFRHSDVKIQGVNYQEVGLYLALNKDEETLQQLDLLKYCPKRKNKRGRPPTLTGCGYIADKTKRYKAWKQPGATPQTEEEKKHMLAESLKIALLFILRNHVYRFGDEIKVQTKGGPIGLEVTGVLAQIFMVWWDKEFKERMEKEGMKIWLYQRYVDDINLVIGCRSKENSVKRDNRQEKLHMETVRDVGNSIHQSIEIEIDHPSKHEDKKIPILDLKVWIEERENQKNENPGMSDQIMYEFYSKEVSSKAVVYARSALPWKCKRIIMTQEILRILLNCSNALPWQQIAEHIRNMVVRIQFSGYSQKFRAEVVDSALKAYDKLVALDQAGIQPLHRPKKWKRAERNSERKKKKNDWFRKGGYETVIFVPATPGSELKKRYDQEIKKTHLKIKTVEKTGATIKSKLQKSDPLSARRCTSQDCLICTKEGTGPCRNAGITYKIKCLECEGTYIGETARCAYTRGKEHLHALRRKDTSSVMWRHAKEEHSARIPEYKMSVTGIYGNDALLRQVSEAVQIRYANNIINNREEWNQLRLPNLILADAPEYPLANQKGRKLPAHNNNK